MKIAIVGILLALIAIFGAACKRGEASALTPSTSSRYKPGQVWSIRASKEQTNALITILRVDSHPKYGNIVHVAISGISFPNDAHDVQHMPFAEAAVDKSGMTLVREGAQLPDYQSGYDEWRRVFDGGRAGVFTISIADGLEAIRQTIQKK